LEKLSLTKVESFIKDLEQSPELKQKFNDNPKEILIKNTVINPKNDAWIYRLAVTALSLAVLICSYWSFNKRQKGNNGRTNIYYNKRLGFIIYRCTNRIVSTNTWKPEYLLTT
jgi:hypothetical protein